MDFPQPQMIDVNGVSLEVFTAGQGTPLVLCHGWPEHAYSWRYQIQPLVDAGYHVIVPNQRGYGHSSRPQAVTDYDIHHLTGDLMGLLDHFGYEQAAFVGHDWGAIIVWNLAMMHRERVSAVANLVCRSCSAARLNGSGSGKKCSIGDFYIVHFNRQPGVADDVFATHTKQFLNNMYRTNQWQYPSVDLGPGMNMINMATLPELADGMPGDPLMSDQEMQVFLDAFATSGLPAVLTGTETLVAIGRSLATTNRKFISQR